MCAGAVFASSSVARVEAGTTSQCQNEYAVGGAGAACMVSASLSDSQPVTVLSGTFTAFQQHVTFDVTSTAQAPRTLDFSLQLLDTVDTVVATARLHSNNRVLTGINSAELQVGVDGGALVPAVCSGSAARGEAALIRSAGGITIVGARASSWQFRVLYPYHGVPGPSAVDDSCVGRCDSDVVACASCGANAHARVPRRVRPLTRHRRLM
jgi:hypothetical protein